MDTKKTKKKKILPKQVYVLMDIYGSLSVVKDIKEAVNDFDYRVGEETIGIYKLETTGTVQFVPNMATKKVKK